ncbi:hypothetical protein XA68_17280 [Ophiocordyceps unilateralis]|uniref:Uncharacterized protein n=1 Tax=Ophiocordyceps unilateralis TaxID=268505 RepID=A0A2A9PQW6_OPHUN|nr:hypothetical protein XA68_17280 [Ophiocordyceps unilateralis]
MERDLALRQAESSEAADGLRLAAEHLESRGHPTAIEGGARLVEMMHAILNRMDALERKVDSVDRRITVSNRNAILRARNYGKLRGNVPLEPLYSFITGEIIEGFPETRFHMEKLPTRDLDRLLRHLDEPVDGPADQKISLLKWASGIVLQAI